MSTAQESKASKSSAVPEQSHEPQHPSKLNPSFQEPRRLGAARPDIPALPLLDTNLTSSSISLPGSPLKPKLQHEDRLRVYTPYPPDSYPALHSPSRPAVSHPQPQPHHPQPQGRERPSLPQIVVTSVAGDSTGPESLEIPKEPGAPTTASVRHFFGNE